MPRGALPGRVPHSEAAVCCAVKSQDRGYERQSLTRFFYPHDSLKKHLLVDMSVSCGLNYLWAASVAVFRRLSQAKLCEQANIYDAGVEDLSCWQTGPRCIPYYLDCISTCSRRTNTACWSWDWIMLEKRYRICMLMSTVLHDKIHCSTQKEACSLFVLCWFMSNISVCLLNFNMTWYMPTDVI